MYQFPFKSEDEHIISNILNHQHTLVNLKHLYLLFGFPDASIQSNINVIGDPNGINIILKVHETGIK